MRCKIVRYKVKPGQADENVRLIQDTFAELQAKQVPGVRYVAYQLPDGSFIHMSFADGDTSPIPDLDAFKRFSSGLKDRTVDGPLQTDVAVVGNYRMLSE